MFLLDKELWHHEAMQKTRHFFLMFFLYKVSAEFQLFSKTRRVRLSSEAEDRGWPVVITTRIWDQWRHSGVSRRENPPCFWLNLLMPSTSSRYIIAQWCAHLPLNQTYSVSSNLHECTYASL